MKLLRPTKCVHWFKLYQLYKQAFPIYERKPFAMIFHTFQSGKGDVWYVEDNNTFIGLAVTLNSRDLILLDYFAIVEGVRGQHYGSDCLLKLQEYYENKRIFVEIESVYEDVENIDERNRRKHFYLKNGMKECFVLANVFGTDMELLGYDSSVTFEDYYSVYVDIYGPSRATRLIKKEFPQ